MKKLILPILVVVLVFMIGFLIFSPDNGQEVKNSETSSNVSIVDGKQIITINVKGGYSPRNTSAKANLPTQIKLETEGTFDCSTAITIPSLGYNKNLPPSGETLVDIPTQQPGSSLKGICAMGMYNFNINFN